VATDIVSGEEVVIRNAEMIEAVRASISVPGIFTPVRSNGRILVNDGLVNAVPVSAVYTMDAEFVIAIDFNHQNVAGKNLKPLLKTGKLNRANDNVAGILSRWVGDYRLSLEDLKQKLLAWNNQGSAQFSRWFSFEEHLPNILEVLLSSINIMEARITQSLLCLDRPYKLIPPPLGHIRFLESDRAEEIIAIGYEHTQLQLASLSTHHEI
jgi:NTE family protein